VGPATCIGGEAFPWGVGPGSIRRLFSSLPGFYLSIRKDCHFSSRICFNRPNLGLCEEFKDLGSTPLSRSRTSLKHVTIFQNKTKHYSNITHRIKFAHTNTVLFPQKLHQKHHYNLIITSLVVHYILCLYIFISDYKKKFNKNKYLKITIVK